METIVTFRFGMRGDSADEDFLAATRDEDVIRAAREELSMPESERHLHIHGPIQRVRQGDNLDWAWQHVDSVWRLVETKCGALRRQTKPR